MPRLLWLADAARSMGLTVVEVDGWKTRGRDEMNPRGVIAHHTATSASRPGDYPTLNTIINGRSDLPGPLSQYGLGRSGTVYVIASGKANHAGDGQWDTRPLGGSDFLDHSTEVIGIEAEHTGKSGTPWPTVQLDAYHRLCAGVLAHLGKPVANLCAHREWAQPPESTPNRKPDPIDLDMDEFRRVVAWHMNGDDMALTADEEKFLKSMVEIVKGKGSNAALFGPLVDAVRAGIVTQDQLGEATSTDLTARNKADIANRRLDAIKAAL